MNKLFQLTLLTAALSASFSHAGISSATGFIKVLGRIAKQTRLNVKNPTGPSQECLNWKSTPPYAAQVITRKKKKAYFLFETGNDAATIIKMARNHLASKINWLETEK